MRLPALLLAFGFAASAAPPKPPWPAQYKIKPQEKDRLTAADVVGPDGIVYPDWRTCGVQRGIPRVRATGRIEQFGGKPDDGADDSAALDKACRAVGARGGAVVLGEGTYHLDRPVTVRDAGVVIRGAGRDKTRVVFRYAIGEGGIRFYWPPAGSRVGRRTPLILHCRPGGLAKMSIEIDGRVIGRWTRGRHSGNTFAFERRGAHAIDVLPDGPHKLKGLAEYGGGKQLAVELPIVLDSKYADERRVPSWRAAILFAGAGSAGASLKLAADGRRGDTVLRLKDLGELKAGDWIMIDGPATARWKKLTRNACRWGTYRRNILRVVKVDAARKAVTVNQPLRIEFPTVDGSYVKKLDLIERCGLEDVTIEQTRNLWITSALFQYAANCWARGVTVRKCGRFPVYGQMAKWCEIRDCVFDDAWFKGGGGTAYAGWQYSYDCLMDSCTTYKLRHGPLFQWSASGCVIRRSTFHDSDAQWHAGWTNENLIEQCVVHSRRGTGSYGYGMWASPPRDTAHGPNGPRNVVYNCDVTSERDGLWMGGMNEAWIVVHNRFVVKRGAGMVARTFSFDHILRDNVFVLRDGRSPMVRLQTADCFGVEIVGNRLYGGSGKLLDGPAKPAVMKDNRALPLPEGKLPPRPKPAVESLFEWQRRKR